MRECSLRIAALLFIPDEATLWQNPHPEPR